MTLSVGIKGNFTLQEVSEVIRAVLEQNECVVNTKYNSIQTFVGILRKRMKWIQIPLWKNLILINLGMMTIFSTCMQQKRS